MSAQIPSPIPDSETNPGLEAYYSNKRLMWRNVGLLAVLNVGWAVCFSVVTPLMQLRMYSAGFKEGALGLIGSVNAWLVSFLVMYFSWKSDHTISRWGRRIPYLWISAPVIIATVFLFPAFQNRWILLVLLALQLLFMDMKNSTIALLPIDLVPRTVLARTGSVQMMAVGLVTFLALRYGMQLADFSEEIPYLIGGTVMLITTTLAGLLIKEPPIRKPATGKFKPWSALQIGFRDRKRIVLMVGLALLNSFVVMYNTWIWLFAQNVLHLSRSDMGSALAWSSMISLILAYPYAWLIDRLNPYRIIAVYLFLLSVLCAGLFFVRDANQLAMIAILWVIASGLSQAGPIILTRSLPRTEVGSITSSASFINNFYIGTLGFTSGQLIERFGQNYYLAYSLGLGMSFVGFGVILFHRHLVKTSPGISGEGEETLVRVSGEKVSSGVEAA